MGIFDSIKSAVAGVTSSTAGSIVDSLANGISKFVTTPEDKEKAAEFLTNAKEAIQKQLDDHQEKMEQIYSQEYAAQLADAQSARDREVKLNESANAGWMSKNVMSLIAILVTLIWGSMTVYLVLRMLNFIAANPSVNMVSVLGVYAGLTGTMGILMNYYFGNSHSSVQKDDTIATIAKQP